MECSQYELYAELKNYGQLYLNGCMVIDHFTVVAQ